MHVNILVQSNIGFSFGYQQWLPKQNDCTAFTKNKMRVSFLQYYAMLCRFPRHTFHRHYAVCHPHSFIDDNILSGNHIHPRHWPVLTGICSRHRRFGFDKFFGQRSPAFAFIVFIGWYITCWRSLLCHCISLLIWLCVPV